jgi:hypothetical protein
MFFSRDETDVDDEESKFSNLMKYFDKYCVKYSTEAAVSREAPPRQLSRNVPPVTAQKPLHCLLKNYFRMKLMVSAADLFHFILKV